MQIEQANRYIQRIQSGEEIACVFVKQAVARHLADLEKRDWPFVFDVKKAEAALTFFKHLRHTSGAYGGKPFNLQDNQAFLVAMLFGWRWKDSGQRRFTQAYVEMARKAGKSELAAGIEIYTGFFEKEDGAQVYTAATTRDQADMVFRAAKKMARLMRRDSKVFAQRCEVRAHSVNYTPTDSFIQKVSADAGTLDGLNPHCAVIDEYHAHKTDEVKGVMQTGMGARESPLLLIITTAGFDKNLPCYSVERKNAVAVLSGERTQDNLFAVIFTLDEGDDWQDESVWRKANPNLGSTPTVQYLREQVQDAINKGSSTRTQVLTKNFNVWMDAPKVWIPDEVVVGQMRPITDAELAGRTCYVGVDLASVKDITAVAIFCPPADDAPALLKLKYFLPEDTIAARAHDTNYMQWVDDGHLIKTPGNRTDNALIRKAINATHANQPVLKVSCDQWNSTELAMQLEGDGLEVLFCRQNFACLSEPCKRLEKMFLSGDIEVDLNPVTAWMFRNVALDQSPNDDIKPNKKRSIEKIDGVSATLDAMFAWLTSEPPINAYSDVDFFVI